MGLPQGGFRVIGREVTEQTKPVRWRRGGMGRKALRWSQPEGRLHLGRDFCFQLQCDSRDWIYPPAIKKKKNQTRKPNKYMKQGFPDTKQQAVQ